MSRVTKEVARRRAERARELSMGGATVPEIASRLGVSEGTASRYRKDTGVAQRRAPNLTPEQLKRAQDMIGDGCPHVEIARTLGVSPSAVSRRFPRTGWTPQEAGRWSQFIRNQKVV